MEEVIKYFEGLEERIAENEKRIAALEEAQQTNEAVIASLEAELDEFKSRPAPEPVVSLPPLLSKGEGEGVYSEQEPVVVAEEPEKPEMPEKPETPEAQAEPVVEEKPAPAAEAVSPKAAVYGKAVDDIRQAISLGDRFLYQRELFGQNAELMQKTLTKLNELGSFAEAMEFISRFNWDTESNSYQQFIVALHRRFG